MSLYQRTKNRTREPKLEVSRRWLSPRGAPWLRGRRKRTGPPDSSCQAAGRWCGACPGLRGRGGPAHLGPGASERVQKEGMERIWRFVGSVPRAPPDLSVQVSLPWRSCPRPLGPNVRPPFPLPHFYSLGLFSPSSTSRCLYGGLLLTVCLPSQ